MWDDKSSPALFFGAMDRELSNAPIFLCSVGGNSDFWYGALWMEREKKMVSDLCSSGADGDACVLCLSDAAVFSRCTSDDVQAGFSAQQTAARRS